MSSPSKVMPSISSHTVPSSISVKSSGISMPSLCSFCLKKDMFCSVERLLKTETVSPINSSLPPVTFKISLIDGPLSPSLYLADSILKMYLPATTLDVEEEALFHILLKVCFSDLDTAIVLWPPYFVLNFLVFTSPLEELSDIKFFLKFF